MYRFYNVSYSHSHEHNVLQDHKSVIHLERGNFLICRKMRLEHLLW